MDMNNEEYKEYVEQKAKPSPLGKNMLCAFFVGGTICLLGEILQVSLKNHGFGQTEASTICSMAFIILAAVLTGLGVFDKIAKHAGAGTLVPITGFANAVVAPAMEFKSEGVVTGTTVKLFTVAGPVLVFGISASVVYGMILYVMQCLGF